MCNKQTPPLQNNYNKKGTGSHFQLGVRYFVPPFILLLLSQEEFAKYVDYLFKFLPYSLKSTRKPEVFRELGYSLRAHRESKT